MIGVTSGVRPIVIVGKSRRVKQVNKPDLQLMA